MALISIEMLFLHFGDWWLQGRTFLFGDEGNTKLDQRHFYFRQGCKSGKKNNYTRVTNAGTGAVVVPTGSVSNWNPIPSIAS